MGELRVLNRSGDVTIEWRPDDKESVEQAKEEWKGLKEAGYEFFEMAEGGKGKRLTRFSKKHGKVLAAPGVRKPEERKTGKRPKANAGGPNDRMLPIR